MKKDYTSLILIVSTLTALLFTFVLFSFFKIIKNKNKYTSEVLTTLSDRMIDKDNAEILINKSSELDKTDKTISSYFIDSTKINIFVDGLEKLGSGNNTKLIVKNVGISNSEKNTILVEVSITGSFNDVTRVIYLLENSPFYIDITRIFVNKKINPINPEIKNKIKSTSPPIWQADISFNVLSL